MSAQPDPFLELARRAEAQGKRTEELLAELLALDEPPLGEHVQDLVERALQDLEDGNLVEWDEARERLRKAAGR